MYTYFNITGIPLRKYHISIERKPTNILTRLPMGDGNICKIHFYFNSFVFSKGSAMGTFTFHNRKSITLNMPNTTFTVILCQIFTLG